MQIGKLLYTVSRLMGHSSIKMTERYAHLAPETQRAAAMELEGVLDIIGGNKVTMATCQPAYQAGTAQNS